MQNMLLSDMTADYCAQKTDVLIQRGMRDRHWNKAKEKIADSVYNGILQNFEVNIKKEFANEI